MKQISVFVENKAGTLMGVLQILKDSSIQLYAICMADITEYGICRIICAEPQRAFKVLKDAGVAASITDVTAVVMSDKPGGAADVVSIMGTSGINIAYIYSFLYQGRPVLVFRTDDAQKTREVLSGYEFVESV